ncbi:MAG: hypothetical protein M5U34_20590 [Chloroflexi bacterium]|nr:hypothetical protein [Chloroflexota bacterium]
MYEIAQELGQEASFKPTPVGIFFGEPGVNVPDPFFDGEGPPRTGCIHCGGCMVGCRHNAKNTLDKNYLYFAEKWGDRGALGSQCAGYTAVIWPTGGWGTLRNFV